MADILIVATALAYQILIATLNVKHFDRIEEVKMLKKR
jgi:predicted nucleic acid-binding protein